MPSSLTMTVAAARDRLSAQMRETTGAPLPFRAGDTQARVNAFLAGASQHACAAESTLVEEAKRRLDPSKARELSRASHAFMLSLRTMHARLYGSSQTMRVPWRAIWNEVGLQLDVLLDAEEKIATGLTDVLPDEATDRIAEQLRDAESKAPTRPHPHLPRRGVPGRVARKLARGADTFWDGVQGRVVAPAEDHPVDTGAA